jgi:hypothetical protein
VARPQGVAASSLPEATGGSGLARWSLEQALALVGTGIVSIPTAPGDGEAAWSGLL